MPLMRYKAMDQRGRKLAGEIEAVNAADLESRLSRLGLDLISFREARARRAIGRGRVRRGDLVGFCFHMEQLLAAGVPVLDGLATLRDSAGNPRLREVLADMVESVEGGETLSGAMHEHPRVFGAVFVNLVRAGEQSGRVAEFLASLNEHLRWQNEQMALMRRLLTYPVIAGCVVMLVVFFLMAYLVPQLVSFIEGMGQELPAHTRALILLSDVFVAYWYVVLAAPFAAFVVLRTSCRASPAAAYAVDGLKAPDLADRPDHEEDPARPVRGQLRAALRIRNHGAGVHPDLRGHRREPGRGGRHPPRGPEDRGRGGHQRGVRSDRAVLAAGAADASARREHRRAGHRVAQREPLLQPRRDGIDGTAPGDDRAGDHPGARRDPVLGHLLRARPDLRPDRLGRHLMAAWRAFVMSGAGLAAYHRRGSKLLGPFAFGAHEGGLAGFARYLERFPNDVTCIVADVVEEEFREETVPPRTGVGTPPAASHPGRTARSPARATSMRRGSRGRRAAAGTTVCC